MENKTETLFSEIAKIENGSFHAEETKHKTLSGNRYPEKDSQLVIPYRDREIYIRYLLGTQDIGEVEMFVPNQSNDMRFSITTKSMISTLFSKRKNRIRISCKNADLLYFLDHSIALKQLYELTKQTQFDPIITGKNTNDGFLIRTEFHLAFTERMEVVRPLIAFYKAIAVKLV